MSSKLARVAGGKGESVVRRELAVAICRASMGKLYPRLLEEDVTANAERFYPEADAVLAWIEAQGSKSGAS